MTETVHYPDGSRIMRGYANPGNDGSNPEAWTPPSSRMFWPVTKVAL
jgi:hypothetical protein